MQVKRDFYDELCLMIVTINHLNSYFILPVPRGVVYISSNPNQAHNLFLFLQEHKFGNLYSFVIFDQSNKDKISGESNNVARKIISNKIINAVLLPSKLIH